jgi:eukaryotic-like serine/threonine-protein kinase
MMTADGDVPAELSKLEKGYELLGELSRDEMLTAYVARDRLSGNEVTIKVLRAPDARGREALAHYASDARLLTALEHPNIVAVHSVKWLSEDVVAVVTERVRGPSLRQVLDVAGTLPVARATEVLRGLGRALVWAHSSQIMHRDVRPENVIFEDRTGRVVLSDFGLARRLEATPSQSATGAEGYRAPELADGRYPDRRTDVYSLGIVGWELLTGRRPWPDTMEPIEPGQGAPAPPPLAEVRPGLPPALVAALEGAVQLDRDRRITDVTTFIERLTNVAPPAPEPEEEPIEETPFSAAPTEWVALPVPRMPQKPAPAREDREVPREAAREMARDAAHVVEPEPAASAEAKTEAGLERPVERDVEHEARPAPAESFAPPPTQESQPATSASVEAAASAQLPSLPPPPHVPADAKRRRSKSGGAFRDAPVTEPGKATTPVTEERRAEAALGSAAAASIGVDAPRPESSVSTPPPTGPRAAKPAGHVPSDVELPPPERVPFADMPSEPLRGPISGPARGKARGATRFESMRGGLGTPRLPPERPRGREALSGPPAPPPLQPMWDTPAEFPLPVMPDPRPMPADAAGGDGPTRRQWTRRGIAIAVAAVLFAAAAVTLARMERTPDTTATLMQPENPTGYGGDVVLPPRAGDSVALAPRAVGRSGAAATGATGARRSRDVPAPAASQPTAPPPAVRRSVPAGQPAGRAGSATPTRGATTTARPPTATPAVSPPRTAERPAGNGPCNSPALADQRACLTAAIERSDAALNQAYSDVVAAMRERASTAPGDPDPPEVQRLRAVQRSWVAERDAECRRRGRGREGPLWATPRAQCLEQFSANRSQELSAMLARLRRD